MEYQLDRSLKINRSPKYTLGGSWSLIEEDLETGKAIDRDYFHWQWSQYFATNELFLRTSVGNDYLLKNENEVDVLGSKEVIYGKVNPLPGRRSNTKYSMFGTKRNIKDFNIRIELIGDDVEEYCTAFGWVAHENEWDFEIQRQDDLLDFTVYLRPSNFSKIRHAIEYKLPFIFTLCVTGVSGFYAEWSPSIRTEFIKVLASTEDQKLDAGDGSITPTALGRIREFSISIDTNVKNNSLLGETTSENLDADHEIYDREAQAEGNGTRTDPNMNSEILLRQNKLQLRAIKSIAVASWLILLWLLVRSF